jgi:hypothetical protein
MITDTYTTHLQTSLDVTVGTNWTLSLSLSHILKGLLYPVFFVVELINPVCCSLGLLTWRIFWFSECLVLPFFVIIQVVCLVFFGMSFPHIQLTLSDPNVSNEIAHTTHIIRSKCEYLKLHIQLTLSDPNVSNEIAHTTHIVRSKCEYLKLHIQLRLSDPNVSIWNCTYNSHCQIQMWVFEVAHTTQIVRSKCEYLKLHIQLTLSDPNVSIWSCTHNSHCLIQMWVWRQCCGLVQMLGVLNARWSSCFE